MDKKTRSNPKLSKRRSIEFIIIIIILLFLLQIAPYSVILKTSKYIWYVSLVISMEEKKKKNLI